MKDSIHTAFAGGYPDRGDHLRGEADLFTRRLHAAGSRIQIFIAGAALCDQQGFPVWFRADVLDDLDITALVFLGLYNGDLRYAADLAGEDIPRPLAAQGLKLRDMRSLGMHHGHDSGPSKGVAGTLAQARSILNWHATHGFCARCGAPSDSIFGGYERKCSNSDCGASHYPRTDPVVIMTAEADNRLLLGRSPHFVEGMFSALAGFMEPGETIEEAVRRELLEEAGIEAGKVDIIANQPWPFPSSLMIGCHAEALTTEIHLDGSELEDARWFSREEIRAILSNPDSPVVVPGSVAIARNLVDWWKA